MRESVQRSAMADEGRLQGHQDLLWEVARHQVVVGCAHVAHSDGSR